MARDGRAWRCPACDVEWWGQSAVCWVCGRDTAAPVEKLYDPKGRVATSA